MGWRIVTGAAAFTALASAASAGTVIISDASFESPGLTSHGYEYGVQNGAQHSTDGNDATATGTTFSNGAGVQSNGSAWGFAAAPDGVQTAFLQSYNNQVPGSITQDVSGLTAGKTYAITIDLSNRSEYGVDPVTIDFGGHDLGTYTPTGDTWSPITTLEFTATEPTGVISYSVAGAAGDNDIGLDAASIVAVPEPTTWALFLGGIWMAGGWLRSRLRAAADLTFA